MSDRATLLQFIQSRYDTSRLPLLAQAVGVTWATLSGDCLSGRIESLLHSVEENGMTLALMARLEADFPQEAPSLSLPDAWNLPGAAPPSPDRTDSPGLDAPLLSVHNGTA